MIPRFKPMLGINEFVALWRPPFGGDEAQRFESAFAQMTGQKHAIAFPYGRTGLLLLFEAMGLKGREIICPAYTCAVVPQAIDVSENIPVFADSADNEFNMDLGLAQKAITEKTGAIVATSMFGYPVDLDQLAVFRKKFPSVCIIQDCALSYTASWNGRAVHKAGDAALFSLGISKLITSVFGGVITTDDDNLASSLRRLRNERMQPAGLLKAWRRRFYLTAVYAAFNERIYGLVNLLERHGFIDRFVKYYDEDSVHIPADHMTALSSVESRVGLEQLKHYPEILRRRREMAEYYNESLADIPGLRLPQLVDGATYSHYSPMVERRDELVEFALGRSIQLGRMFEYCAPFLHAFGKFTASGLEYPKAASLAKSIINVPLTVDRKQAAKIAEVIREGMASL